MKNFFLLLLLAIYLTGCKSVDKNSPATGGNNIKASAQLSSEETLQWVEKNVDSVLVRHVFAAPNGLQMAYRLFSPDGNIRKKVPLVVFLHGRGDRGTDNGPKIYKSTGLFMSENALIAPNMQALFPCYVLAPQCSDKTINEEWAKWVGNTPETPFKGLGKDGSYTMSEQPSESGAAALALIDKLIDSLNIDPDRVYLIGKSMGGFGTWEFTARRPELFAAAVPMAGYSDPGQIEKIKHIPFWIFHGNVDEANPVEGSRTMYKLLTEAKAEVKYTEYEGANHGESFRKAFNEPELIPWMFSKTRERKK
ncbi:MAG: prolyl oligopeptidase family serine peptidase [Bacteroidia bacterium]